MSAETFFTRADLAACAEREVRQRARVYPRLVQNHSMTPANAERETAMMRQIATELRAQADAAKPSDEGRLL